MAQYIPKSALVAEIERRTKVLQNNPYENHKTICHLDSLKQFISTLEVKGVDLEKELKYYCNKYYNCDYPKQLEEGTCSKVMPHIVSAAKHFFELGLKVHKGE